MKSNAAILSELMHPPGIKLTVRSGGKVIYETEDPILIQNAINNLKALEYKKKQIEDKARNKAAISYVTKTGQAYFKHTGRYNEILKPKKK